MQTLTMLGLIHPPKEGREGAYVKMGEPIKVSAAKES